MDDEELTHPALRLWISAFYVNVFVSNPNFHTYWEPNNLNKEDELGKADESRIAHAFI